MFKSLMFLKIETANLKPYTLNLKSNNNVQDFNLFQGKLQGVDGKSNLANLGSTSTINYDCAGCNIGYYCNGLGNGFCNRQCFKTSL